MPGLWFPLKGSPMQRARTEQEAIQNYELRDELDQIVFANTLPGRPTVPDIPTINGQTTVGNIGVVTERIFLHLGNGEEEITLLHELGTELVEVRAAPVTNPGFQPTTEWEQLKPISFLQESVTLSINRTVGQLLAFKVTA